LLSETLLAPVIRRGRIAGLVVLAAAAVVLLAPGVVTTAAANPAPPGCTNIDPFPQADFGANPNPALAGQNITFDGSCSTAPCEIGLAACQVRSWSWDFGDGSTGSGAVTSHAYAAAGTYTVTLTACECYYTSATSTVSQQVYVLAPPL
jgi:PKD repeat protein